MEAYDGFREFLQSYELGDVVLPVFLVGLVFGGVWLLSWLIQGL